MASIGQKISNWLLTAYFAEVEEQAADANGNIPLRQVVKVGEGTISATNTPAAVDSATVTEVTAGATSGTLLAASTTRKAASVFNKDTAESVYLNIGAAATTSKIQLRPGEWWHMADYGVIFTEEITCIRGGTSDVTLVVVSG